MSKLELVTALQPQGLEKLKTPTKPFLFQDHTKEEAKQIAEDMVEAMYRLNGLGISANQLGLPWSIFAMRGQDFDLVCFNPSIAMPSTETIKLEEGCLSWPGLILNINRWRHLRVRFSDYEGYTETFEYTGMTARVFQHELEHLAGEVFFDGVSRFHLERAVKNARNKGFDYSPLGIMKHARK